MALRILKVGKGVEKINHSYPSSEDVKWYKHVDSLKRKKKKRSEISFHDCQRQEVRRRGSKGLNQHCQQCSDLAGALCLPLVNPLMLIGMSHVSRLKPRCMSVGSEAFELTCHSALTQPTFKALWVSCLNVCLCVVCMSSARGGQKGASSLLRLELQVILNYHIGSGNQTRVFRKKASAHNH